MRAPECSMAERFPEFQSRHELVAGKPKPRLGNGSNYEQLLPIRRSGFTEGMKAQFSTALYG
jgi:hypothetical protein